MRDYRVVTQDLPCTLGELEQFIGMLRYLGLQGNTHISCNYKVNMTVRFDAP
jgi:hypothetical protein